MPCAWSLHCTCSKNKVHHLQPMQAECKTRECQNAGGNHDVNWPTLQPLDLSEATMLEPTHANELASITDNSSMSINQGHYDPLTSLSWPGQQQFTARYWPVYNAGVHLWADPKKPVFIPELTQVTLVYSWTDQCAIPVHTCTLFYNVLTVIMYQRLQTSLHDSSFPQWTHMRADLHQKNPHMIAHSCHGADAGEPTDVNGPMCESPFTSMDPCARAHSHQRTSSCDNQFLRQPTRVNNLMSVAAPWPQRT